MPFSVLRKSASISSDSSGERMFKKLTAPYLPPSPNIRALPKRNEDGAIKSLVESPDGASHFQSKENGSPSGWKMLCMTSSRSLASSPHAEAPMLLK